MVSGVLIIFPSAPVVRVSNGFAIDKKMYEGVLEYVRQWPGRVVVVARVIDVNIYKFGFVFVDYSNDLFEVVDFESRVFDDIFSEGDVALLSADDYQQLSLWKTKKFSGMRVYYVIEYTLSTRMKFLFLERRRLRGLLGGIWFLIGSEISRIRAFLKADGIQCNGLPAFYSYQRYCKNTIHYFDTRLESCHVPNEARLVDSSRPLRIFYSGRLISAKGVQYIIPLVLELKSRGVKFVFEIYGDGDLRQDIEDESLSRGLTSFLSINKPLDFSKELIPLVRSDMDVAFMPHVQGDPSCTYFETISLGVPVLGFANEAWKSIFDSSVGKSGWVVPVGDIEMAADLIESLSKNPSVLNEKRKSALDFGRGLTKESQFIKRVKHLLGGAG